MPKAMRINETGGPEVLRWENIDVGEPGEGQARVRHTAVGVNFIDTYHRSGLYPVPLPSGIGSEAAGVVEAVGPGVTVVRPGERVAYGGGPPGSYAEARVLPARHSGPDPGWSRGSNRGGGDAQGNDRPVPDPPDLPRQAWRNGPVPRRGGRSRADRLPVAQGTRGDGHRDGRDRRRRRPRPGPTDATTSSSRPGKTSPSGCGKSPAGPVSPSCTIRSARTRS